MELLLSTASGDLHVLTACQPASDACSHLPGVRDKLEHVWTAISSFSSTKVVLLGSPKGMMEDVLALMRDADGIHVTCHKTQDAEH